MFGKMKMYKQYQLRLENTPVCGTFAIDFCLLQQQEMMGSYNIIPLHVYYVRIITQEKKTGRRGIKF